jgi:hypothetical protein
MGSEGVLKVSVLIWINDLSMQETIASAQSLDGFSAIEFIPPFPTNGK